MPGNINIKELERMAKLDMTDEERSGIREKLELVLKDFEDTLSDTESWPDRKPMIHGAENFNVFREDKAVKSIDRETLLNYAPEKEGGCFKVPKTVE